MKENKTKPDIRFTGFTDDWEQRKLGELLEKYEDPVETPHDGYERLGIRSHAKGTFHSFVESGEELNSARMHRVAANKFILNITFAWEHAVAITDKNDEGKLVSHRFPQFSFDKCLKSNFFKYLILDEKFRKHLELSSPGGAGRNRVLKISDMLEYKIYLPSIDEQTEIGQYFSHLDNLITLHQREKRKDFRKKINIIVGYMNLVIIYKDYGKEENMATRGKSINLFLMDGEASGRIKCTLANWTGLAYKIPRIDLDRCKNREDLKQSGVYFLFGKSENSEKGIVYIGQAGARKNGEGILDRLKEHKRNSKKDYWTEAIVFTTSNNSFGPTEISYLENRFCNLAKQANRYEVKNENDPTMGNITEEKESEMEEFIDYAKVVMGTLGHKVFEPYAKSNVDNQNDISYDTDENNTILYLKRKVKEFGEVQATGMQTSDGFVVFSGSHISTEDDNTVPQVLKERKKTVKLDENGNLIDNMPFSSPSYAAMFVIGKSANGLVSWKDENGKTLKDLELNK